MLRGSLLLSGLILLVFPLAKHFELFLGITLVWSLVAESVRPASLAALTTSVRPEHRKAAVAVFRLAWAGTIALERFGGTALWTGVLVVGLLGAAVLSLTEHRPLGKPS